MTVLDTGRVKLRPSWTEKRLAGRLALPDSGTVIEMERKIRYSPAEPFRTSAFLLMEIQ